MLDGVEGYTVRDDDDDDPVLVRQPEGTEVDTWRESYPYDERMKRTDYEEHKRLLQIELLKLQKWSQNNGRRHVIVFEGRDAAGKGFTIREVDTVRQWKLSPTDLASLDKWDDYTMAKEDMFAWTDTEIAPWIVVKSNDKKRARVNAMRHVLSKFDYDNKDHEVVGRPDPLIVGRALAD